MNFSAASLVKNSASQLLYFSIKTNPIKKISKSIELGQKHFETIIQKNKGCIEKRGIISINEDLLFFCVDLVQNKTFIEIKMVEQAEDWYFKSSILQATFYASLLKQVQTLDTPKFRQKEGFSQEVINVPKDYKFELWYGNEIYEVFYNQRVLDFYLNKLNVIKKSFIEKSFNKCRTFDLKYKHKEFDLLKPIFRKKSR